MRASKQRIIEPLISKECLFDTLNQSFARLTISVLLALKFVVSPCKGIRVNGIPLCRVILHIDRRTRINSCAKKETFDNHDYACPCICALYILCFNINLITFVILSFYRLYVKLHKFHATLIASSIEIDFVNIFILSALN